VPDRGSDREALVDRIVAATEHLRADEVVMSVLHNDQPRSPGATTSTVCGSNWVTPSEDSAVMLLFSQPPGESCVPYRVV